MSAAKKSAKPKGARVKKKNAEDRFVENLIIRGEAVTPPEPGQPLPPGATHVLEDGKGRSAKPKVKRVRFSMR